MYRKHVINSAAYYKGSEESETGSNNHIHRFCYARKRAATMYKN